MYYFNSHLPTPLKGHIAALTGALVVHSSLAAWAMMPEAPIVIPQQQIIQVSMVAPSVIPLKPMPDPIVEKKIPRPKTPPKKTGMVKTKSKAEPVKQVKKQDVKTPEPQKAVTQQTQTAFTSGMASPDAKDMKSAYTEPMAASYLKNPPPQYPAAARRKKQQGTVMLDVLVSMTGNPQQVKVGKSSGISTLDEAALAAVKQWKFVPARRGSQMVEASIRVPVKFRLN